MTHSLESSELTAADTRVAEARRLYEQGSMPVHKISAHCGLTKTELYIAAKRDGWAMRSDAGRTRRGGPREAGPFLSGEGVQGVAGRRKALIARAWALAEAQKNDLERRIRRLQSSDAPSAQRERDARAMAALIRALKELAALDGARTSDGGKQDDSEAGADFPRDVDELKAVLARHLEGLRRERAGKEADGEPSK